MKWWRIYLSLFCVETLGLLIINLNTGSQPSERILFNLSFSRLILVLGLLIIGMLSIWAIWRSFKYKERFQQKFLNERFILSFIIFSFLAFGLDLYLLSLDSKILGDFQQVYLNFKPFLVWGFIVTLESWFFSMTWFGHIFIGKSFDGKSSEYQNELFLVFGLFLLLVVVKIIWVIPSAYGPVIRGDEMRYFEMANYLYNGNFHIENFNHSPFLYPLLLSVAFAFKDHAYQIIKLLNVLYSSGIVFPLYLITRKYFSKKESLLITATACVLPFHLLFPRMVMSENLYFLILLWVIFFILHRPQSERLSWIWNAITGISIGMLYMTRYVTLAIIPFLLLAWWLIYPDEVRKFFHPSRRKLLNALSVGVGILCGYSPWLLSGLSGNIPLRLLLGFGITAHTTTEQLTFTNLLIWLSMYLSYFILMAAPLMSLFFTFPLSKFKEWKKETRDWFILVAALLVGFLVACVRHSWRAYYNSDTPSRIMGRYILYFTPLFIIAAFLALKESRPYQRTTFKKHLLTTVIQPMLLVTLAHQLLLGNLFHLHDGDLINILGSVDAAYFQYLGSYFFVLLLFIYGITCYLTWRQNIADLIKINLAAIMLFYLTGLPAYYQELLSYQEYQFLGTHIIDMYQSGKYEIDNQIRIITPSDATERDRALLSNTFHFSNLPDLYVDSIENFSVNNTYKKESELQDVQIVKVNQSDLLKFPEEDLIRFGDSYYIILN